MIHVHDPGDAGSLVEIAQVVAEIWDRRRCGADYI